MSDTVVPSQAYGLVLHFLKSNDFEKSSAAFEKEISDSDMKVCHLLMSKEFVS